MRQEIIGTIIAFACAAMAGHAEAGENSGAIGRIVPDGGVVAIAGPAGAIVKAIHVRPGAAVKEGEILVTLQGTSAEADRDLAEMELRSAKTLAASRVAAQNLSVQIASQRLAEATRELNAYQSLGPQGTSARELARLKAAAEEARVSLDLERTRAAIVKTETETATRAAEQRLDLASAASTIRAPHAATVLSISRRVGERLTGEPVVQLADLTRMYVLCQVYEGDLLTLKPGMKASVRSATLPEPLTGTVEEIGRLVDTQSRLGEVRIKLDKAEPANRLVGMEVEVVIAR